MRPQKSLSEPINRFLLSVNVPVQTPASAVRRQERNGLRIALVGRPVLYPKGTCQPLVGSSLTSPGTGSAARTEKNEKVCRSVTVKYKLFLRGNIARMLPISGETSMAPIMTAVEPVFNPTEAMMADHDTHIPPTAFRSVHGSDIFSWFPIY